MATIHVAADAIRDEETPVRIDGLAPGATVQLVAESDGFYDGGCVSRATFEADADGVVDTSEHAPTEGSYVGVAPMGWLWSMVPNGDETDDGETFPTQRDAVEISLTAAVDGSRVSATTTRRPTATGVTSESVENDVVGRVFSPAGDGPHPGVIVLHGSEGEPGLGVASLLAAHGYTALALQYFGDPAPLPDALLEVPVESFDEAAEWFRAREDVSEDALGLYGWSKGAEAALVAASRYDWPDAIVAVSPTTHRWMGLDRSFQRQTGSWTADGEVLPYVPFLAEAGSDDDGNVVIRDLYERSLERVDDRRREAARIPVEQGDADVFLVSGGDDQLWPSAVYAERLERRLADRDDGTVEHRTYEAAGHSVRPPYLPTAGTDVVGDMARGGSPAANARAGADVWPRALDWLDELLAIDSAARHP